MAKNPDVRIFDERDNPMVYIPPAKAHNMVQVGKAVVRKCESGRLLEIKLLPVKPPTPSGSKHSPTTISASECRINAFAHLKLKFGEKLNATDEIVLEKMTGFTPGQEEYLGPSWGDRVVVAQLPS